jgi:hypothetical protein
MKLYIVKGIEIDRQESNVRIKRLSSFIGYFTNLKEVYKQFDSKTVQSYSSVATKIKETDYYTANDSRFLIDQEMINFYQIIIKRVKTNTVYSKSKNVYLDSLFAQELSEFKR